MDEPRSFKPLPGIPQSSTKAGGSPTMFAKAYEVHRFTAPDRTQGSRLFSSALQHEALSFWEANNKEFEHGGFVQKVERSLIRYTGDGND